MTISLKVEDRNFSALLAGLLLLRTKLEDLSKGSPIVAFMAYGRTVRGQGDRGTVRAAPRGWLQTGLAARGVLTRGACDDPPGSPEARSLYAALTKQGA